LFDIDDIEDQVYLRSARQPHTILAFKLRRIFLQILLYVFNLLYGEQGWRPRPPQKLTKPGQVDSFENTTLKRPYPITVVNTGFPAGYRRDDVSRID